MAVVSTDLEVFEDDTTRVGFKVYIRKDIDDIPELRILSKEQRLDMKAVSAVLPFRVNNYVIQDLIDWNNIPDDPIYQLTFSPARHAEGRGFRAHARPRAARRDLGRHQERGSNDSAHAETPHPAGQMELNVPKMDHEALDGMQHKYRETVLFFPAAGQTCHAYCTYCFRWAPVSSASTSSNSRPQQADKLVEYVAPAQRSTQHPLYGRRPACDEVEGAPSLYRAIARPLARALGEHPHRQQSPRLLAL